MSAISTRRTILAGAATLPALAVPALAIDRPDAELLRLGEQLKPLVAELHRLERERHRLWEEIHQAGGPYPLSSLADIKASQARFEAVAKKNGYSKLCDQVNPIAEKGDALAKRILEIEPTDRTGDSIHAAAVLLIDEPEGELGELLKRMAGRAGFSVTV